MHRLFVILPLCSMMLFGVGCTPSSDALPAGERSMILVKNQEIPVWRVTEPASHVHGLSRIELSTLEREDVEGMLFVFPEKEQRTFWMKDMRFALDMVWIADGVVAKIDASVLPLAGNEPPETRTSEPFMVDMVLELPAGEAAELEIEPGVYLREQHDNSER